ncbi:MAG: 6-phosphogluconolactonase [Candidatus Eiseniibacteriota bacterium]
MSATRLTVHADSDALAAAAGAFILECGRAALAARGRFALALSGGRTWVATFAWLALRPAEFDWSRAQIYFADERAVPPDHPDSNFRLAREALIDPLRIPPTHVHRMKGEYADLAAAAEEYQGRLRGPLDCLLLGIGEDGHIASLFPGGEALSEREHRVRPVFDSPKPPPRRLTLTPRAIDEAREVVVLASGAGKAAAVAAALEGEGAASKIPARLVRERTWKLDAAAAAQLRSTPGLPRRA